MQKISFKLKFLLALITISAPFTPLSGIWNPFVEVSDPGASTNIAGPVLDVSPTNNAVAIWTDTGGIFANILASSYTFGSGWGPPVTVSDTSLNPFDDPNYLGQGDPSISINSSDYVVAVWEGSHWIDPEITDIEGIFSVTRSSNGVWSPVQTVTTVNLDYEPGYDPENPFVDVSNSGLAVTVWTESRNFSNRYIMANFLPFGGIWGNPIELTFAPGGGNREDTPRVKINSSNNAAAVWKVNADVGMGLQIGASTYNAGTNIWTTVVLDTNVPNVSRPTVGIDEFGNAVAAWIRLDQFSNYQVVSSSFNFATQTWGPVTIVTSMPSAVGSIDISESYTVVDQFGTATTVWTQNVGGTDYVFASTLPLGGTWSIPVPISAPTGFLNSFFTQSPIAVDLQGNVIVIYELEDGSLYSVANFVGFGWQIPEFIAARDNPILQNIGYGSCGFAIALWNQSQTVEAADNFAIFPPPSNLTGTRCCLKFATQKSCLSILEWESSSCIAFYNIFRNGVLIATVPGTQNTFTDPVCSRNQSVTYTVTAINIFGFESAPVSITVR